MASLFSTTSQIAAIDTRVRPGTITLPLTTASLYRQIMLKDLYGSFPVSTLTISTQSGDYFEDGTTTRTLSNSYEFQALYAGSTSRWHTVAGTRWTSMYISSLRVDSLQLGSGDGWADFGPLRATAISSLQTVTGLLQTAGISTLGISTGTLTSCNISTNSLSTNIGYFGVLSSATIGVSGNSLFSGTIGVGGIATLAAATVTALSNSGNLSNAGFISNNGILSNTNAASYFAATSNTGTLGVAGIATLAAATVTALSNSGNLSNAGFISNNGILSNTTAAAYFQNTSNTGTLGVAGIATLAAATVTALSNSGNLSNAGFISNNGILSNTTAAAYFQNTSNTGTLGVGGIATLAAATVTALSNSGNLSNAGFISNNGILSNTTAAAYFQNTSNTGTLGVGGIATLAAVTVTALSNSGNLSNAGFISNNGILSNLTAAAYFQNTSNTGTFGVAGIATYSSNIVQNATAAYISNSGTTYLASTGVGTISLAYPLDVYGIARSAIPISSISNSNATFGNNSYGIYYYITNSGFSNIIFTSVTPTPAAGWYILLRNNTGSYLSITPTGASAGLLASAFTIPPSNSVTVAYDAPLTTWVAF